MNCCWALILLVGVALGPRFSGAALDLCRNAPGYVEPPANTFYSYQYTLDGTNACTNVDLMCGGVVRQASLTQGSWFINPVKGPFGRRYTNNQLDVYKVQCPPGNFLHLFPQFLDVEFASGEQCTDRDFVTVEAGSVDETVFCGTDITMSRTFYNFGRGMFIPDGNATITFCTDSMNVETGFVFRATCVDPRFFLLDPCADFAFYLAWDPEFTDLRGFEFERPPNTFQPHKRSARLRHRHHHDKTPWKQLALKHGSLSYFDEKVSQRHKRFDTLIKINLEAGQCATYDNFVFEVDYNDGTIDRFLAYDVVAFNEIISTRIFTNSSELKFFGPAEIEIKDGRVTVRSYSVGNTETFLLPGLIQAQIMNNIFDYIWENFLRPYPLVVGEPLGAVPLRNVTDSGDFVRYFDINLVGEMITNGTCRRVVIEELSPARGSTVDKRLVEFCDFFYFSCNPYMSALCEQILDLNLLPRGKK